MRMANLPGIAIDLPLEELRAFCERWEIVEFALFGSVLRDDFRPDSDIDVLVTFAPGGGPMLFDYVRMERELSALLRRRAEVVDRRALHEAANPIREREILRTARSVRAA